jgi:hypothetical protein
VLTMYLSPFLVLVTLLARLTMALVRGVVDLMMLPARTALAVALHLRRPQPVLMTGAALTILLIATVVALLLGAVR